MYRLDMYPGTSLLRTLYMNKPLLYSGCFCSLISLISFNCRIYFPNVCSIVSSASMSQSTDISFTCNGRSLIKRLKRIGSKTEPCGTPYFTDSLEE